MWIFHPLHGEGYQFWSGIAGSFLTSLPGWFVAIIVSARHKNCHHKRCWRLGHNHPKFGWPACKDHWNEKPEHLE